MNDGGNLNNKIMNNDKDWLVMPCILFILFLCVLLNLVGFNRGIDKQQQEAVITGHAEWVSDQSGKPQFKWKECK
jgi:hypothetical protein